VQVNESIGKVVSKREISRYPTLGKYLILGVPLFFKKVTTKRKMSEKCEKGGLEKWWKSSGKVVEKCGKVVEKRGKECASREDPFSNRYKEEISKFPTLEK